MCNRLQGNEEYTGESTRTFGERLKEHLRAHSPIYDHTNTTGHHIRVDNFSVVDRDAHNITRTIKEAMYIRVNDPSLKRNTGVLQMSYTWDEILFNTLPCTLSNPLPHPVATALGPHPHHTGSRGHTACVYTIHQC